MRAIKSDVSKVCAKFGFQEFRELLLHYPRRYEDRARWLDPFKVPSGESVTILGTVAKQKFARWRGGKCCFEAWVQPEGVFQTVRLVWFGMPYLKRYMTEGKRLIAHGKIFDGKKGERMIHHPEFELVTDEDTFINLNRITPIYPATEGISQRMIRHEIFPIVTSPTFHVSEVYAVSQGMPSKTEALRQIHFPESWEELARAKRRLVFDEFFRMQLLLAIRRQSVQKIHKKRLAKKKSLVEAFQKSLPFQLTGAQARVCAEMDADLQQPYPMNRLLQGDVGSGKTLVAVHALLRTLECGMNGALLVPTEILAEQHYLNLKKWLVPMGIDVVLWTRNNKPSREDCLFARNGRIFVGTHALIQEKASLPKLGLGVIDEQHKFGVLQRTAFQQKGEHPDLLVMTATPIPRTLCLTFYGDLDISTLDEIPPGRGILRTALRDEDKLPKVWEFIKKEIHEGRQAYVVYPLVEDSEKMDLKSVEKEAQKLRRIFGENQVGVLHGRMDGEEKEEIMTQFRERKLSVLAATTVIEVGVDVPNATVMVIENAERFGLAQLHQLRGRVGRGAHTSYCVLIGQAKSEESWRRLKIMEETSDGFRLAEEDLKIRGPGDILGTDQKGLPPLKLADMVRDEDILLEARKFANEVLKRDPYLHSWPDLRKELESFFSSGLIPAAN